MSTVFKTKGALVTRHAPVAKVEKPLVTRLQGWIDSGALDQHAGLVDLLVEAIGEIERTR